MNFFQKKTESNISEQMNVLNHTYLKDKDIDLFILKDNMVGLVFELSDSRNSALMYSDLIHDLFHLEFPKESLFQFFTYKNKNISSFIEGYKNTHENFSNLKKDSYLKEIIDINMENIENNTKSTPYSNYRNLLCFSFPKETNITEIMNCISKIEKYSVFAPMKRINFDDYMNITNDYISFDNSKVDLLKNNELLVNNDGKEYYVQSFDLSEVTIPTEFLQEFLNEENYIDYPSVNSDFYISLSIKNNTEYQSSFTISITEDTLENLESKSTSLRNSFSRYGIDIQEKNKNVIDGFLGSLPLQVPSEFKDISFKELFSKSLLASIVTSKGNGKNLLLQDRSGQIIGYDFFSTSINSNFLITGSAGSGISYLLSNIMINYLSDDSKIKVIDFNETFNNLTSLVGGEIYNLEDKKCFNFFSKIQELDDIDIHLITNIVFMMFSYDIEVDFEEKDELYLNISSAIKKAFEDKGNEAGMKEVLYFMRKQKNKSKKFSLILDYLKKFGDPKGEAYSFFNGRNNITSDIDLSLFNLTTVDANRGLYSSIVAAISFDTKIDFSKEYTSKKKILIIQDFWLFYNNEFVTDFFYSLMRYFRIINASLGITGNCMSDFLVKGKMNSFIDNINNKVFLKYAPYSINMLKESKNFFPEEIEKIKSLKVNLPYYSEFIIKNDHNSLVYRLSTSSFIRDITSLHCNLQKNVEHISIKYEVDYSLASMAYAVSEKTKEDIEIVVNRYKERK